MKNEVLEDVENFVDRRTTEDVEADLATPILLWYDKDGRGKRGRRRCNGAAFTVDGKLLIARATCSRQDQFVKFTGRQIVIGRLRGRAQKHVHMIDVQRLIDSRWINTKFMTEDWSPTEVAVETAAAAYNLRFPQDETGRRRVFNVAKMWQKFKSHA